MTSSVWKSIRPYAAIARPDHWFKNIFILPGVFVAQFFMPRLLSPDDAVGLGLAFLAACLTASSNYVLNEILDAPGDALHPDKQFRPVPSGEVRLGMAWAEWLVLGLAGFAVAAWVNPGVLASCILLWVMGLIYNVRPVRAKDLPYLDVLTESINNPIRMGIGWYAAGMVAPPTLSVLAAYWMFGAFLMATKRFAEFRHIGEAGRAASYRKSFRYYNEERLLVSILFYTSLFGMFSGVFISRYRMELVLAVPFVALAVAAYLRMGFKPDSPAMYPESLWRHPPLVIPVGLAFIACVVLLFLDLPWLPKAFSPNFTPQAMTP